MECSCCKEPIQSDYYETDSGYLYCDECARGEALKRIESTEKERAYVSLLAQLVDKNDDLRDTVMQRIPELNVLAEDLVFERKEYTGEEEPADFLCELFWEARKNA